jgi:hypothetical protein
MMDWTIKILLFFGITIGLFMGFNTINDATNMYPAFEAKESTAQLIIAGVCMAIAGGATYLLSMKVVTKENMTKIVGFGAAAGLTFLVVSAITMPSWGKYVAMIIGGILGAYFVAGNEKYYISYGTGFIGAVLLCMGIGYYAGGFPTMSDAKGFKKGELEWTFFAYIAGIIALTIGGGLI